MTMPTTNDDRINLEIDEFLYPQDEEPVAPYIAINANKGLI